MPRDQWDLVLIGDGSGTKDISPCGWACVMLQRYPAFRRMFFGYDNTGGIMYAELHPYGQALHWHWVTLGAGMLKTRIQADPSARINVHIICDNRVVVEQGNSPDVRRNDLAIEWAKIEELQAVGYRLTWHWRPRNNVALNRLCDALASFATKVATDQEFKAYADKAQARMLELNPDQESKGDEAVQTESDTREGTAPLTS